MAEMNVSQFAKELGVQPALLLEQLQAAGVSRPLAENAPLTEQDKTQLLDYLRKTPQASLGAILGYWYGTPEGELLNRLAAEEPVPGHDAAQEFGDIISHLASRLSSNQSEDRRRELDSIPFASLSPEQKREYLSLLAAKPR